MTSVIAGGVQVVRASLEASVVDLQVVQGSIIIHTHQHLPEADVSSEAAACLAAFLAEHLRVSPCTCPFLPLRNPGFPMTPSLHIDRLQALSQQLPLASPPSSTRPHDG